jgi:hypothetical protein
MIRGVVVVLTCNRGDFLMLRALRSGLLIVGWLAWPLLARAGSFDIDFKVEADKMTKTAQADSTAAGAKPKERPVLTVKAGTRLTARWKLTNTEKATFKDVVVHFFVVKEEKAGQATVPKLNKDVAAESALTMDFEPKDSTRGELAFTLDTPGVYLLRVETIGAGNGGDGHEHFAAVDVVVE